MTRPDPVRVLLKSLKIYSPSTHESELANYLASQMEALGYSKVRVDGAGNVAGEVGSGDSSLLLCGHMDTVPGKLPVKNSGGWISGRGAADAKSPLCALMFAGAASADSGLRVTFAAATEEEGNGAGINEIIRRGINYRYAVFGEPSGATKITVGYRGRVSLYLTVKTKGGHAGSPWANRSAFDEFNSVMSRIRDFEISTAVPGDHFGSVSITPTMVSAGSFHNVIPELCEATLDLRVPPGMRLSHALASVRSAARATDDSSTVELKAGEFTEPYLADPGSSLVRAFQRAIILRLKAKPSLIKKTGTGDMNTFAQRFSTECVTFGPGNSKTSHTDHEAVEVQDYLNGIEVLKEAISQLGRREAQGEN